MASGAHGTANGRVADFFTPTHRALTFVGSNADRTIPRSIQAEPQQALDQCLNRRRLRLVVFEAGLVHVCELR